MSNWRTVHAYRALVAKDKAIPINCPEDETELTPFPGNDDEPRFLCMTCGTKYDFGLVVWEKMRQVVKDNTPDKDWS